MVSQAQVTPRRSHRSLQISLAVAALAVEGLVLRRRGYSPFGGRVLVRCRAGHEFRTLWLPGVSILSIRLGPKRLMRCRPGRHWSLVSLVDRPDAGMS